MLKYTGSCTRYCKITRSSTSCTGPNHGNQTVKMVINFLLSNQTIAVNVTGKVLPLQITCEFSEQDFCKYYFAIWKWIFFCSESFLKMKLFLGNGTCRNDVSSSLPGCLSTQNTVFSTEPETTQGVTSALTEKNKRGNITRRNTRDLFNFFTFYDQFNAWYNQYNIVSREHKFKNYKCSKHCDDYSGKIFPRLVFF